MNDTIKTEVINDLASGVKSQREIGEEHSLSQQSVSYLKKANAHQIELVRSELLTKLTSKFIARTVRENKKADKILDKYDTDDATIPDVHESAFLSRLDNKTVGLLKGIIAPHSQDTNISVTKNEQINNIDASVLKMFHAGAKILQEADITPV